MNLDLVFMEKYEIQKLRDLPIEKVAKEMGMKVEHHKALCPFHDDHHASLSFNTRKNNCRCYVCMGDSVGTIDLVMKYLRKDFLSACRWLAEEHQVQLEEDRKREASSSSSSPGDSSSDGSSPEDNSGGSSSEKSSSFDASRYARFFEHPWLNLAARRFLFEERKIDERVAAWCRLTSWTDKKGVNWLQIPYFSTEGKLIGIQNRNLDYKKGESIPRFRFPYGAKCSIYNLPIVRGMTPGEQLFITEGCSDCWAMLSAGHKAIAIPSATLLKPEDKKWLAEIGSQLKIEWHMFPDRDAPGESLFLQLKEILPSLVHHQLPPGCKDFSEYYLKEKK
ncbi:CHC2 zinc finger domain-containing protein [Prevotella copri]|uniref:CHC2 zinc finger domain-containing protein n=1 Tax=Segatella copri TaxID=165179 RepID=A0AAP3BH80_9BACT|nr:CHC2 zinc finger domain-containing protein [Segatella copri]MCW4129634.1 CHC2 zinc finger domain-containing protein [Segatella copri]MCW4416231.1 CHC2 zinc finger domain-containing protein [Segatella copri]MCW4422745.1 CHC2 zinc finger domain-containing protein [Segatella copri]